MSAAILQEFSHASFDLVGGGRGDFIVTVDGDELWNKRQVGDFPDEGHILQLLRDRPGFDVDFITRTSISADSYALDQHEILMPMRGHWRLTWEGGTTSLNPGDTCAIPPGLTHSLTPAMTGEASMFRVRSNDDPAGPTMVL